MKLYCYSLHLFGEAYYLSLLLRDMEDNQEMCN